MNKIQKTSFWSATRLALAAIAFAFAAPTLADPPTLAARIGYLQGPVSFAPAGDNVWVEARLNRPITIGDSLWTDNNARTELQFGSGVVRLDEYTNVQLLNLDDRFVQLQLTEGTLNIHAGAMRREELIEIDTPNLAFTVRQPGDYRIDVDGNGATTVSVRRGVGEVYGDGAAFTLRDNDVARFFSRDLREREFYALAPLDDFDRWGFDRDRRAERAVSARYVSAEVVGYTDLDQYGTWRADPNYGHVWFPREVARDWAPYRYGHWSWIEPWGWTWVDDAPWGFAPFHYGRWATVGGRWGWVPGPINVRPVYAPALVAFVGGPNFTLSISSGPRSDGIGWFPLAPGEVYRPAYNASRDYVRNVNVSNTVVNTTVINNIYNNPTYVTQVNYRHAREPNAVTAVPATAFAQAQSVQRSRVAISQQSLQRGQVIPVAAIVPTQVGMAGGAPTTNRRPTQAIAQREVMARTAPAAAVAPAAQRIDLMRRDPGRPVAQPTGINSAAPAANVRVVERNTPQPVPGDVQRGMAGPSPRSRSPVDATPSRAQPAAPARAPGVATPAPSAAPRERGGMGSPNVRPTESVAPAAAPPAMTPPGAARERPPGRAGMAPAAPGAPPTAASTSIQRQAQPVPPPAVVPANPQRQSQPVAPPPAARQRDTTPAPQAATPRATPANPAPPTAPPAASRHAPTPPSAAPPTLPPQAAPAAPRGAQNDGDQEIKRRGRGNADDDKKERN